MLFKRQKKKNAVIWEIIGMKIFQIYVHTET